MRACVLARVLAFIPSASHPRNPITTQPQPHTTHIDPSVHSINPIDRSINRTRTINYQNCAALHCVRACAWG